MVDDVTLAPEIDEILDVEELGAEDPFFEAAEEAPVPKKKQKTVKIRIIDAINYSSKTCLLQSIAYF